MKRYSNVLIFVVLLFLHPSFSFSQKKTKQSDRVPRCCFPIVGEISKGIGYIDEKAKIKILPEFSFNPLTIESLHYYYGFSEGFAWTSEGFIGKDSEDVFSLEHNGARRFSEGLAAVDISQPFFDEYSPPRWGFINTEGKFVIPAQYLDALGFSEGLAAVELDDKWGFIDKTGKFIISPQYSAAFSFSEGLAAVELPDKNLGFIDKSGKQVVKTIFPFSAFNDSVIDSYLKDFNKNVEKLYGEEFSDLVQTNPNERAGEVPKFSNGLFPFAVKNKWGYIDKNGKVVISPRFDFAGNFYEGAARVGIGKRWGFINEKGKFIIPPRYRFASDFSNGLAFVIFRITYQNLNENYWEPGSRRYTVSYGYINRKQQIVFRGRFQFDILIGGGDLHAFVDFPPQVEISVESSPPNSEIYFIPSATYTLDKSIIDDDEKLALYYLGMTDDDGYFVSKTDQQNYWVVLINQGRKSPKKWFKVNEEKENKIKIVF